jgi:hypothetical protein
MRKVGFLLFSSIIALFTACTSREPTTRNVSAFAPPTVTGNMPFDRSEANSPTLADTPPAPSEYDNQMTVAELRERLDEVKAIERQARKMVALRNDWENGVAECMEIMKELKPRSRAAREDYKRMLSPAGMEIASAANSLNVCVNCLENDDDTDCRDAREFIRNAEKELKKEVRRK